MDTKKYLLATISGFVVMFLLAWLGHQVIIPGLADSSPMEALERAEPMILGIAAAYLVLALIMAYMYPKGVEGDSVFGNGIRFGILVGLLFTLPMSLIFYSVFEGGTMTMVVVETVWHMIEEGAGGVAIAWIYGMKAAAPAAEHI